VHVKRKWKEGCYFARHIEPVRRGFDRHIEPLRRRVRPYLHLGRHALFLFRTEGWLGVYLGLRRRLARSQAESVKAEPVEAEPVTKPRPNISVSEWVERVRTQPGKRVLCTDLARPELVQAFMTADLFVFASTVEYSPLVLYEAAAAGLPFLTGPVGNAEEIATWTGGGLICSALKDKRGYTWVDPSVLAGEMRRCMDCPDMLARLGKAGKQSWRREFTWKAIAPRYEAILAGRPDH
jgi:hypothetical protein